MKNSINSSASAGQAATDSPARSANEPRHQQQFVQWLRAVAPYIHAFRGKTFVVGVAGELIAAGLMKHLAQDLSLLNAMGMRIVVVHGSRPQVIDQLRLRQLDDIYAADLRVTDAAALQCVKGAAGQIRLDIEAAFSQGLPNTPMQDATVRAISGNFVTAKPVGIVGGVDHLHTGMVRKVDAASIDAALQNGAIVLMSPLGFSPTGEAFNLTMEDVTSSIAISLQADKLVFLTELNGIRDADDALISEISQADAQALVDHSSMDPDAAFYLKHAVSACRGGVTRAHILPFGIDGSILLELFRHDGVGTMVVEETLEALRDATADDIGSIMSIIQPLEEAGILVKRDHALIEREIERFSVIEHDGVIFGCASLHAIDGDDMGELACLAVSQAVQGQGDGDRLLRHIEQRARAMGLKRLFVLTTRTMHWFIKRGFKTATPDALPAIRREAYSWTRRSLVLIKTL